MATKITKFKDVKLDAKLYKLTKARFVKYCKSIGICETKEAMEEEWEAKQPKKTTKKAPKE